jgi:glutathione S-transferase
VPTDLKAALELWQFRLSMYPEKARWALDYKGIPHVRRSLLPGPHIPQLFPRFGQKGMPILTHGDTVVKGSAEVIDYLERTFPAPALYPADPALCARALELQAWFDDIGTHIRRAFFYEALSASVYFADLFSTGYPASARAAYRMGFPVTRGVMKLDMHITKRGADEGLRRMREALDMVIQNRGRHGYLVGDCFSVADLTAAVVLHPAVLPDEYPLKYPHPRPQQLEQWLAHWTEHPATAWVREMYSRHRGHSAATEDCNG